MITPRKNNNLNFEIKEIYFLFFKLFKINLRNDKIHPYKSGVISARIFLRNNFLKVNENNTKESLEKDIDQLCYFLSHSNKKEKYIWGEGMF